MSVLRVVLTGGAGQIAYSLIPLIARGLVFGPSSRIHLRLLDIPAAAQALEGVVMEIQDSVFSCLEGVVGTTDEAEAFDGAQVAILLGGFPRRPGMERGDLIAENVGIMKRAGQALERYASRDCKVVVVANPAATNCLVLSANAPSIPRRNFSFLSRLDHDRMVGMLLERANQALSTMTTTQGARPETLLPTHVRGVCVWGNHSSSQVPDASSGEFCVDGRWIPAQAIIGDPNWLALEPSNGPSDGGGLVQTVRKRGAAVLQARKLSSAMSAANATAAHLTDWLGSSVTAKSVSMGVFSDGNPYGVPDGIMCSFPVRCGGVNTGGTGKWEFDPSFRLSEVARRQLAASVAELKEEEAMALSVLGGGPVSNGSTGPVMSTSRAGAAAVEKAANGTSNMAHTATSGMRPISSL